MQDEAFHMGVVTRLGTMHSLGNPFAGALLSGVATNLAGLLQRVPVVDQMADGSVETVQPPDYEGVVGTDLVGLGVRRVRGGTRMRRRRCR